MSKLFKKSITSVFVTTVLAASPTGYADNNTNYGNSAGSSQTSSANNNTNVGVNAGAANTTGDNTTIVGYNAGAANTANDNTFIGANSGEVNTTGTDNTFIGSKAGALNTATDNTFIGTEAGASNTTGQDNTFIGEEAGESNIDGDDNVFIGEQAGYRNTSGENNTFIGATSGASSGSTSPIDASSSSALTGHNNTTVGEQAGYDLKQTASRNTAIGSGAGNDIGEAFGNTMVGADAAPNNENSDFGTFVGAYAGWDNNRTNDTDKGNRNTALGAFAGYANRKGQDNVWLGAFSNSLSSLYSYDAKLETDAQSKYNGISSQPSTGSLPIGNTDIHRTTVLGAFAGANDNDSIAIGYGAISDQSNSVTIGTMASGKGRYDVTIGDSATNTKNYSVTLGYQASTTHQQAITIGYQAASHADNTVVIGNANTISWDPSADAVTALGKNKNCYYDDSDHGGTYEWVCDPLFRFSDVVSQKFSAIATDGNMVEIDLWADNGDDFADQWSLSATDNGNFAIASYVNSTSTSRSQTRVKTDLFTIANNGDVTISGGLTLNSDERLKKDITPIKNAINKINEINGVTYYWNEELGRSDIKQYGLIAQNVEQVFPEMVKENQVGIKSVNYQALIPVLINATQEQQKQLDQQQKQLEQQKRLVEQQQKQIELLLQKLSNKS